VRRIRQWLRYAIVIALLVVIGAVAYVKFGEPSPEVLIRTRAINAAQRAMLDSDWQKALSLIEQALTEIKKPDWELLTWDAVLLEKSKQPADRVLNQALEAGDYENVWITYGMVANLVDESSLTLKAGQALVDHNAESVQGSYLIAQAYDTQKQFDKALQYYDLTLKKIDQAGGNEGLYVAIRQRVVQINLLLMK